MRLFLIACSFVCLICYAAFGGGSITETAETTMGTVNRYEYAWTSGTNGASGNTQLLDGRIERVVIKSDTGSTVPSNNYDVTFVDEDSVDLLAGLGANVSTSATENIVPGVSITDGTTTSVVPFTVHGICTIIVTNAGVLKGGDIIVYIRP